MVNKKNKSFKLKLTIIGCLIVLLILNIILFRNLSTKQLDDLSPLIECERKLIEKSEVLMIIPLFQNKSIAENKSWCKEILSLNKTLGMHGVYHTYEEFKEPRNESYIKLGIKEFEKCFGFTPKVFEAPQVSMISKNEVILKNLNFKINGYWFNLFHKVYHCKDTGILSNKIISWL